MVKYTLGKVIKLAESVANESKKVEVVLKRKGAPKLRARRMIGIEPLAPAAAPPSKPPHKLARKEKKMASTPAPAAPAGAPS